MMTRASGFTKAGMERWSLYKKLSTLRVHITPNTAVQTKENFKHVKLNSIIHTVKHRLKRNTYPSGHFCYLNRGFNPASFIKKRKVGLYIVTVFYT